VTRVRAGTVALLVVSLPVLVGIFIYGRFVLDLFCTGDRLRCI